MKGNHGTLLPVSPNPQMVFEFNSEIIRKADGGEIRALIKNRGSVYPAKKFLRTSESHWITRLRQLHEKQGEEAPL
ncbi:hypothetical protein [Acerihabitans arboris]|uniref:hypothetical protein n=1 Tax=Acerihabitans arboris TaxID=2691583 RepID=UPI001390FF6B|nr:hypothetical protein [Acerihabitans arboris]